MGLFGLSNAEALVLAEQMRSKQAGRDRELQEKMHNAQMKQQSDMSKQDREIANRQIAQMATEARKTEPFLTLTLSEYDGERAGESICIRASDIKEIRGKQNLVEKSVYDESCRGGFRDEYKLYKETHLVLWDTKVLKVKESVQEIQSKINESINAVNEAQTKLLREVFMG